MRKAGRHWKPPDDAEFLRLCIARTRKEVAAHFEVSPETIDAHVQARYHAPWKLFKKGLQAALVRAKLEKMPASAIARWILGK